MVECVVWWLVEKIWPFFLLQDIETNCGSIVNTKYWFVGTDVSTASTQSLENLDALTTYNILYQVQNDQNFLSTPQRVVVTTGELGMTLLLMLILGFPTLFAHVRYGSFDRKWCTPLQNWVSSRISLSTNSVENVCALEKFIT